MSGPYHLEIYIGDAEDPMQVYHSATPFGAIHRGDYIFADTWDYVDPSWRIGDWRTRMVVEAVEHRLWIGPDGEPRHQIAVSVTPERQVLTRCAALHTN